MKNGIVRLAAAIPNVKVADCDYNAEQILNIIKTADKEKIQIVCFPELCITAYTCGDLFHQKTLIDGAEKALSKLLLETKNTKIAVILGIPLQSNNCLFNAAIIVQSGKIIAAVPKSHLPNYGEFYEKRWFTPANMAPEIINVCGEEIIFGNNIVFNCGSLKFGVEICEDLWMPIAQSSKLALAGANVIFNLSASNELIGKNAYIKNMIEQQSASCHLAYVYASSGSGESTQDIVFAGNALIAENGIMIAESERFVFDEQIVFADVDLELLDNERVKRGTFADNIFENCTFESNSLEIKIPDYENKNFLRNISSSPFIPSDTEKVDEHCSEIFSIQIGGLSKRITHTNIKNVVLGISGGLDSTLALLVCVKAFDKLGISRKNITGVTMPGFGTTSRTYNNAVKLMKELGVTALDIDIKEACEQHLKDIGHDPENKDITYENAQARERTQILMDIANQTNAMVIGTGDLSELALGWATYNGDHMSMYGINSGIPKTLVKYLVVYAAENFGTEAKKIITDITKTPISPELLPASKNGKTSQITEDFVGPYELHDFFIYYTIRFGFSPHKIFLFAQQAFAGKYTPETIKKWMKIFYRRFFTQQFKRSCMPDGPKVGSVNISPRGDWRMPSDASFELWIKEVEKL